MRGQRGADARFRCTFGPSTRACAARPDSRCTACPLSFAMASEERARALIAGAAEAAGEPGGAVYNVVVSKVTENLATATTEGGS
eukprot:2910114-Pyramimonas_sp.AAC.1